MLVCYTIPRLMHGIYVHTGRVIMYYTRTGIYTGCVIIYYTRTGIFTGCVIMPLFTYWS